MEATLHVATPQLPNPIPNLRLKVDMIRYNYCFHDISRTGIECFCDSDYHDLDMMVLSTAQLYMKHSPTSSMTLKDVVVATCTCTCLSKLVETYRLMG